MNQVNPPRALLSVYDKTGIVAFADALVTLGWEIISSGGTAQELINANIPVTEVSEITQSPEMLEGRVKTLHPLIHGGILADRANPNHLADLKKHGITPIDLVVSNLYPFNSDPGIEMIDIGGSTMVRAAAKNHAYVGVIVEPTDYDLVVEEIKTQGTLTTETRSYLAHKAFMHTASYDHQISGWLNRDSQELPDLLHIELTEAETLRYGENPHQKGSRYRTAKSSWWDSAVMHGGKEMSYLNVFDTDAAWRLVHDLSEEPCAVIIKHANPCGVAIGTDISSAYQRAHECDPVSAFGGIVAVNREVTEEMAQQVVEIFTEVLVAPGFHPAALSLLTEKKNLRIFEAEKPETATKEIRSIGNGFLVQTTDPLQINRDEWEVVTSRHPTENEWLDLEFAWTIAARVTSNTIVFAKDLQAVGIGAGQQNRRDAGRIASTKAAGRATGGACASDAFFPFQDGLDAAIEAGVTSVIQPGGSIRDDEVIKAAEKSGIAMVFTKERHFRH